MDRCWRTLRLSPLLAFWWSCTLLTDTTPFALEDAVADAALDSTGDAHEDLAALDTATDGDPEVRGDAQQGEDVADAASDPDGVDDLSQGSDAESEVRNGCGGRGALLHGDSSAAPGDPCGAYGEGQLVCASLESLVCVGRAESNDCGGVGVLPVALGGACGTCDDGLWACAESGAPACFGARAPNGCGGCAVLPGRPGAPCTEGGEVGAWVCTTRDTLACIVGAQNACGGEGVLTWVGTAAGPGAHCDTRCGTNDGVLVCAGGDALECVLTSRALPPNACGGCGPLPGVVGQPCGVCGEGRWACEAGEGGAMVCEGAGAADACGGCGGGAGRPGEVCGDGLRWACDGPNLVCAAPVDEVLRNACGGTSPLAGAPGDTCGACGKGVLVCASQIALACEGDVANHPCGGCDSVTGRPGDACGTCASGRLACEGARLVCAGDAGSAARNACGGCGELGVVVGAACGACLAWTCQESGAVRCDVDSQQQGCGGVVTCAELRCGEVNRACVAGSGQGDAVCGACLEGFEQVAGQCVSSLGIPTGVTASQGSSAAHVAVSWSGVSGAMGYHVYRDGDRVTESPVTDTLYFDVGAPTGGAPGPVSGVLASSDQAENVRLNWDEVVVPLGASATYRVRAVSTTQQSNLSAEVTGYRGAHPVTGHQVQIDGGAWLPIGTSRVWMDESAPSGRITLGAPTATRGLEERVQLAVAEAGTAPGAMRRYRVRAVNTTGPGDASIEVSGHRVVGTLGYQWEWSASRDGTYAALAGASAREASDESVLPGGTRWYRVRVTAPGAEPVVSAAVEGRRAFPSTLGNPCASDGECGPGVWCPTDTAERRCSPRPVVGEESFPFQWVPAGAFVMGSPAGEIGRTASNEGQVSVTLTRDYYVQRTPVTQRQWFALTTAWNARPSATRVLPGYVNPTPTFGTRPSCFRSPHGSSCSNDSVQSHAPVERVNLSEAVVFANALSVLEDLEPCYLPSSCRSSTGHAGVGGGCPSLGEWCSQDTFTCTGITFVGKSCRGYRLPTEAEWERAARGGTTTATYGGDLSAVAGCVSLSGAGAIAPGTPLRELAWFDCNSNARTHEVGALLPNTWGIYDMLGLLWEITWTRFDATHTGGVDPTGPATGAARAVRGGAWNVNGNSSRAAARFGASFDRRGHTIGFRLVRSH